MSVAVQNISGREVDSTSKIVPNLDFKKLFKTCRVYSI